MTEHGRWYCDNPEAYDALAQRVAELEAALRDIYDNNMIVEVDGKIMALTPRDIARRALTEPEHE